MNTCYDCLYYELCNELMGVGDLCIYFKDKNKYLELPCPVGTDLYRIDSYYKPCSFRNHHKDEWYCSNVLNCHEECDSREEYHIFVMKNADAMTILGNEKYFGIRTFISREEAEKKLEELQ